jgi:hypothetical protein
MTMISLVRLSLLTTVNSLSVYSVNHISIASHLLTSITSMSPNPSADSHWHEQAFRSTQAPSREHQSKEMPSAILSQVVERLANRLEGGTSPSSHQNLPEQAPSAGNTEDPFPADQSHNSSLDGNAEGLSHQSHWEVFDKVVGRLERKVKGAATPASQRQTTHGASTAQKSSNNPDQGNNSIGPPNDKVSGENN